MDDDRRKQRLELVETVVLCLAVLAIAWCSYQSTLWSGIQTFRLVDANDKGRMATAKQVFAEQQRGLDTTVIIHFAAAVLDGKQNIVDFYLTRSRPEMRVALRAWLDTNPLENSDAPPHPGAMPQYSEKVPVRFEAEYQELRAQAEQKLQEANDANQISDRYVLINMLFATVLCLVGLGSKIRSVTSRSGLIGFASLVYAATLLMLVMMPLARE
jgi:hypothetical protein